MALSPAIVSCLLECPLAPPTHAPVHTLGLGDGHQVRSFLWELSDKI